VDQPTKIPPQQQQKVPFSDAEFNKNADVAVKRIQFH
jgi:hypothetical protein